MRGTRYTLALFVPLCVTLMVLAEPILEVWLGDRYGEGDVALAILVSYWLLYGGLVVTPGFLVGAGRARDGGAHHGRVRRGAEPGAVARPHARSSGSRARRSPPRCPFFLAFPFLLRLGLRASGAPLGELARRAWAAGLPARRACSPARSSAGRARLLDGRDAAAVARRSRPPACSPTGRAFYGLVLDADERALRPRAARG